jgi:hypothetical protein
VEQLDRVARDLMIQEAAIGDLRKPRLHAHIRSGTGSDGERSHASANAPAHGRGCAV